MILSGIRIRAIGFVDWQRLLMTREIGGIKDLIEVVKVHKLNRMNQRNSRADKYGGGTAIGCTVEAVDAIG